MVAAGGETGHVGQLSVHAQQQERPGADRHRGDDGRGGQRLHDHVGPADPKQLPEKDPDQVPREGGGARDHNHPQRQHAHKEQPDGGVGGELGAAGHQRHPRDHHGRSHGRPGHGGQPEQHRQGHPGKHAVGQRIADEGQASQHHKGADRGTGHRHQHPG